VSIAASSCDVVGVMLVGDFGEGVDPETFINQPARMRSR
jgi:hypothetical protein